MSFRDAAVGGRAFVSDSSASVDRKMAGAFARMVSQGIAFNAKRHGMLIPLSLLDEVPRESLHNKGHHFWWPKGGAEERTRTFTPLRAPAPQAGASAIPPLPRGRAVGGCESISPEALRVPPVQVSPVPVQASSSLERAQAYHSPRSPCRAGQSPTGSVRTA